MDKLKISEQFFQILTYSLWGLCGTGFFDYYMKKICAFSTEYCVFWKRIIFGVSLIFAGIVFSISFANVWFKSNTESPVLTLVCSFMYFFTWYVLNSFIFSLVLFRTDHGHFHWSCFVYLVIILCAIFLSFVTGMESEENLNHNSPTFAEIFELSEMIPIIRLKALLCAFESLNETLEVFGFSKQFIIWCQVFQICDLTLMFFLEYFKDIDKLSALAAVVIFFYFFISTFFRAFFTYLYYNATRLQNIKRDDHQYQSIENPEYQSYQQGVEQAEMEGGDQLYVGGNVGIGVELINTGSVIENSNLYQLVEILEVENKKLKVENSCLGDKIVNRKS